MFSIAHVGLLRRRSAAVAVIAGETLPVQVACRVLAMRAERHDDRNTPQKLLDGRSCPSARRPLWPDKQQWIGRHDLVSYHALDISDIDIRFLGDTATVPDIKCKRSAV